MNTEKDPPSPARSEVSLDGITLKPLGLEDAQAYFDLINFNPDHLRQRGDETADKYKTAEDVIKSIQEPKPNRLRFGIWANEIMVGSINMDSSHNSSSPDIGYWVGAEHIGHGYATKALQLLIPYALGQPGIEGLRASAHEENEASLKTLENCGFKQINRVGDWINFNLRNSSH